MPSYVRVNRPFMTIQAGQTLYYRWTWEDEPPGSGPNKGPVFFMADPISHRDTQHRPGPAAEVKLTTYDLTKCRHGPGGANEFEVFYEFKIRCECSDPNASCPFRLEMIMFKDLQVQDFS